MPRRALLIVIAIGLVATARVWLAPTTSVPDTAFSMGHLVAIGLARNQLLHATISQHLDQVAWPTGADFRPLLWPVNLLALPFGNVLAFNLFCALIPALNFLGGWRLGKALQVPFPAALALILAWNPWVRATIANGQVEQAVIGGAAWIWAAAAGGSVVELAVATVGVGLAAPHVALAAALGLPFVLPRDRSGALAGAASLLGYVIVYLYHSPGFDPAAVHLFAPFGSTVVEAGAPVAKHSLFAWELVWPAPAPPVRIRPVYHMGYLGLPLLLAATISARKRPGLAIVATIALVLAVGLLPVDDVPLVGRSATPYRFVMTALVALAALAAHRRLAFLLVLLVWIEALIVDHRPFPMAAAALPMDSSSPALAAGVGPVLDVPALGPGCRDAAGHLLAEAVRHGRPVPLILRDGPEAWPGHREEVVRLDMALRSPSCATLLGPAIAAFSPKAVVGHLHPTCRLTSPMVSCLEGVLGPPSGEDAGVVWWAHGP